MDGHLISTDVSILVTEPSPEAPINALDKTVHHVLVHRESEEYPSDNTKKGI